MRAVDPLIAELEQERESTLRVLERVPQDKLEWRPHPKSMTLGQLALHVATAPGAVAELLEVPEIDAATIDFSDNPQPESRQQIINALDEQVTLAAEKLDAMSDETAMATWTCKVGDQVAFTVPRIAVARSLILNHWYHHRGQLTVYLRLLGVPLPAVYGPTADENPFLAMVEAGASAAR